MISQHGRTRPVVAGVALLFTLLILGCGLCLSDHDGDGIDDHGMPRDLCWLMLVVPAVTLTVSRLGPNGRVVSIAVADFITVPLSILDPPPRRRLSF